MGLFRIFRPITVDAKQCTKAGTIATDLGFSNVKPGDWIIRGEDGESYILNNEFFQRTFAPAEEQPLSRQPRSAPDQPHAVTSKFHPNPLTRGRRVCARGRRMLRLAFSARKRTVSIHWIHRRGTDTALRGENLARAVSAPSKNHKVKHSK